MLSRLIGSEHKDEPHRRLVKVAGREIVTLGVKEQRFTDAYHHAMTASWARFFLIAALIFAGVNSLFALLYSLGEHPIANTQPGRFLDLLYFSIETLGTVGYGDMHPQTNYGHMIATIEIFTGMVLLAVMTGLIFARFSRPRARFLFALHPAVARHEGVPTLMLRLANARHNSISNATARLWIIRSEPTPEGQPFRRFRELRLDRPENPFFILSWTVFHKIDETSPIFGLSAQELAATNAEFSLNVTGLDETSAQQLTARKNYSHRDIRWQSRYADILSTGADGRVTLDYRKFHEVVADPTEGLVDNLEETATPVSAPVAEPAYQQ